MIELISNSGKFTVIVISYLKVVILGMAKGIFLFIAGSIVGFITTPLL